MEMLSKSCSLADELGVPLITKVPLDPYVVEGGDGGAPVVSAKPGSPAAEAIREAAKQLTQLVPPVEDETCTARIKVLEEQLERLQDGRASVEA